MARARRVLIAVALCGLAPATASAASISGTVTAEGGGGIQGVEVCSRPEPYFYETECAETNASGGYVLDGLPPGSYYVRFFTGSNNLNYVPESYDDKQSFFGDLLTVGDGQELTGIDAELEEGGVIAGTATDADSHGPAAEVEVCAYGIFPNEYFACGPTAPNGEYAINALRPGDYRVRFEGGNTANYLRQDYDDGKTSQTPVAVVAGATHYGIDAALHPGAQIFGRVTEAGTGMPLDGIEVCVYEPLHTPLPEYAGPCDRTDAAGNYAIRSLPEATYYIVFSQERGAEFILEDLFFEQWWNGASSLAAATPLHLVPPQSLSGIDAQLTNMMQRAKSENTEVTVFPALQSTLQSSPKKCGKGLREKEVKGKKRCVRKSRKHRRGSRRHHKHRPASSARG